MFVSKYSNDFTEPCQMNDTVLNYCQRGEVDFFSFLSINNFSHKPAEANKIAVQYSTIRIEMNNVAKTTRNYLCAFLSLISAYMLMDFWQISFFCSGDQLRSVLLPWVGHVSLVYVVILAFLSEEHHQNL